MQKRHAIVLGVLLVALGLMISRMGRSPEEKDDGVVYEQIKYLPHEDDPSLRIETEELVVEIIDNTGLISVPMEDGEFSRKPIQDWLDEGYFVGEPAKAMDMHYRMLMPVRHLFGYHGIRTLYNKSEKRNVVVPFYSWLNLQWFEALNQPIDEVDRRAVAGVGRGWPLKMKRKGDGVLLWLDPLPVLRMKYSIEFQPAEPDGIEFSIRFTFGQKPKTGPAAFGASWPCYVNAYDDASFHYPQKDGDDWKWTAIGERPDIVLGETVDYVQAKKNVPKAIDQALPLGYGRIGEYVLILMFDNPDIRFYVDNNGGHMPDSSVLNPAWDFEWRVMDYPLNEPIGFDGKLIYAKFESEDEVVERYEEWRGGKLGANGG